MGAHQPIAQDQPRETQPDLQPVDVSHRPFQVGESLPLRLTSKDMCRIFQLSISGFYNRASQGDFDTFEILPKIGARAWSGERVQRYLKGEAVFTRTFGRKVRG